MRPFRFAVQATKATTGAEWAAFARRAEDLGYSTLFLADHYLGKGPAARDGNVPVQQLAPIAALAAAAVSTSTLRLGCRVFCVDYHVPTALVKEALTIDLLSDGRLEFGIGAGWSEHEYRAMGVPFLPGPDRLVKLREVVELFKRSSTGEPLELHGRHVVASGYSALPLPRQAPHPPVMIGGARRHVLTFAGREADIVSLSNVPFDAVNADGLTPDGEARRRLAWVAEGAADRFDELDIESSPFFTAVTDDPDGAVESVAKLLGRPVDGLLEHPNVLIGSVNAIVDRLQERRETYGVNYVTIQQRELDQFAPVVARLVGT